MGTDHLNLCVLRVLCGRSALHMRHVPTICAQLAVLLAISVAAQRGGGPGSNDKHVVDPDAADRGKKTYGAECLSCHGSQARGTDKGPNLIRSVLILHDRNVRAIGP